ncbi:hypothetical protein [Wolbachia endosymbiont (group A) of Volucella inflata]|uniref:hypothetical protein n=1 Tax=Wolbachia endosymbiont (group A) of Volucella inflata TaxID=2954065 RepID=UPI002226CC01|nr:hypothetical protein [Wolbachia endosymbiont (group A) of Volucella inflata]
MASLKFCPQSLESFVHYMICKYLYIWIPVSSTGMTSESKLLCFFSKLLNCH